MIAAKYASFLSNRAKNSAKVTIDEAEIKPLTAVISDIDQLGLVTITFSNKM